jgi:predicted ATPase
LYNGYRCVLIPTAEDSLAFGTEECWFHDRNQYDRPYEAYLGSGHRETRLYEESAGGLRTSIAKYVLQAMRSWRVYHFHDTSETARVKGLVDIEDNRDLRDDASNLAAYLYLLYERHPDVYDRIVSTVQLVAPFFDDFDLKPSRLNPDKIRLEWKERGSDTYFNAHALSDGTLRFISLTTLLQMPDVPSTIVIDEPELGLHPYAIALLAAQLRSAAARTQVIVSTQSVTLVNQLGAQDVVVVDREDGQSVFSRLDERVLESWLGEYGLGDLWEKNLLGGRPR